MRENIRKRVCVRERESKKERNRWIERESKRWRGERRKTHKEIERVRQRERERGRGREREGERERAAGTQECLHKKSHH